MEILDANEVALVVGYAMDFPTDIHLQVVPGSRRPGQRLQRQWDRLAHFSTKQASYTVPHHYLHIVVDNRLPHHVPATLLHSANTQVSLVCHNQHSCTQSIWYDCAMTSSHTGVVPARWLLLDPGKWC